MPIRKLPLVTNHIYHIFNKAIDNKPIFLDRRILQRTIDSINYYGNYKTQVRLSHFLNWSIKRKNQYLKDSANKSKNLINLLSYCLMPNHYHLLLEQKSDNGISKFMGNFQNSISRYINTVSNRKGYVFQGQFKAVIIETNEQLIHVSRYIHLNPYSSFFVKNIEDLKQFKWSSLNEYISRQKILCDIDLILSNFKDGNDYWEFVENQAEYQRKLEEIKHLTLE